MKVGILALQGAVEPHAEKLSALGAEVVRVRVPEALEGLSGIILPGGESTTMLHLLRLNRLWDPLKTFVGEKPAFGVCAGAILLAEQVSRPSQESLGALPISVERNSYGRQTESFIAPLDATTDWNGPAVEGVFIRAPRISRVGTGARVLFRQGGDPVLVEYRHVLAGAFHPELTDGITLHAYFLGKCRNV